MDIVKKIKNYTYNQRHCLGQGSFGKVYQGRSEDGVQLAIKKVDQRMISKDPYLRSSLEGQINIMKKLNHPNIVKLFDVVLTSNSIYLIMQFCAGGDLIRYCRGRKLGEEECKKIIKQISTGFQEIVKGGIIHRDLKPANILVHAGVFKICDFGFAKFFGDGARMTRTCVGTPIYMSPQVLTQQPYTSKTDVWSLGILFFELMFGKLPFSGISENQLYRNITKNQLSIPSCSKFTYNLLKGMLEVEESKRFGWNKIFQIFQLGTANDYPPQIPQKNVLKSQEDILSIPLKKQNHFFPKNQLAKQDYRRKYESPKKPQTDRARQIIREDHIKIQEPTTPPEHPIIHQNAVQPQPNHKKPKNSLAYQVLGPPISQKNVVQSPKKSARNPRFMYFVLIELIVNPIESSQSYPMFISSLYHETVNQYKLKIQQEENSMYKKILLSEQYELEVIENKIPKYVEEDLKKSAEKVLAEGRQKGVNKGSLQWIQKIINQKYDYRPTE